MSNINHQTKFDKDYNTYEYRDVTIEANRNVKSSEKGRYTVKNYPCESLEDAKAYIDDMIEACGIEFFQNIRKNPLHDGCEEF